MSPASLDRIPRHRDPSRVPRVIGDGRVEVDATWGIVQPIEIAPGVRTIGELELVRHLEQGLPVVDTRQPDFDREPTIPGAVRIPHEQILDRLDELDPATATVLFCNGPQCTATPDAIRRLLGAGYPAAAILYYRGGIHDWVTLGFPTTRFDEASRSSRASVPPSPAAPRPTPAPASCRRPGRP